MKTLWRFLSVILVIGSFPIRLSVAGSSQGGQALQPTRNNLNALALVDADTVVAVGAAGTVIRSMDGGVTWTITDSGTQQQLSSVAFADANTGMAVGDGGTILRTSDGGLTWESVRVMPTGGTLRSVALWDAENGIVVGFTPRPPRQHDSIVLRTTDGGATWARLPNLGGPYLFGVSCPDVGVCTVVGGGRNGGGQVIYRTTDGGDTWLNQSPSRSRPALYAVAFTDVDTGTAVGYNAGILRTIDGGLSWTQQRAAGTFQGVSLVDATTGTVVGGGSILRTTDGGDTWIPQSHEGQWSLNAVSFWNADTGIVVGNAGTILRTTDGGETWVRP